MIIINILKQLVRTKTYQAVAETEVDKTSLARYKEVEQLHKQVLLNCHLAAFLHSLFKF